MVQIYEDSVGYRNNDFEKQNNATEANVLKDTPIHPNKEPKQHNHNGSWHHVSGRGHAPNFQEIRSQ